ncbi:MAG: HD-GYP domain-containing protein [Eubacterium sp.]|nr:HD-GYP domain-containing protein [Eubacterium sp.]
MKNRLNAGFFIILLLYVGTASATVILSKRGGFIAIADARIPYGSFTGVFSMLTNLLLVLLVIFYKKIGLIVSMILMGIQLPMLSIQVFIEKNVVSIPGFFGLILALTSIVIIYRRTRAVDHLQKSEIDHLLEQHQLSQRLFEQTATALVNAIDAKDAYSHGHSQRVAEYSEKLARLMGKSDEECYRIFYTALLHDVGKIGIADNIINKKGKLTPEEYDVIKTHADMGNQILSSITEYPYLSIGAHYHHERYDGKGYPEGLKGDDIPEIARIISVADAYDAMTSNRSYRETLPQQLVREEIVKGTGTQFDPKIARVMQHLIDLDSEYEMKERNTARGLDGKSELRCGEFGDVASSGIGLTNTITKIHLKYIPEEGKHKSHRLPVMYLFDSLDGRMHDDEATIKELLYFEYCTIGLDGRVENTNAREINIETPNSRDSRDKKREELTEKVFDIEAVKVRDHVMIKYDDGQDKTTVIVALPDSTRFAYIGLTGENCRITDIDITTSDEEVGDRYIPRLCDEITYIDVPEGDIPNVQINGYRTDSTNGIVITDGMRLTFHTMSLPTARLIWHCPYIVLFYSRDGKVGGEDYREYALVRFDGEEWKDAGDAENRLTIVQNEEFTNWNSWKENNKKGYDSEIEIERKENTVIVSTENFGLSIMNVTRITEEIDDVYVALSGDQVALTNIRIKRTN